MCFGQLTHGLVVQFEASDAEVFGEVGAGTCAGNQEDVRRQAEQPCQGDLCWGGAVAGGDGDNAGVVENGLVEASYEGTPQGGPLSPLLSNVVLDELDKELKRRGHQFVRYADDCNIYTASERAGHRVMASISAFITRHLKLKVNVEKSAVGRPWERKFLGFRISADSPPLREIAPKAVARFKHQVRQITRRARGVSLDRVVKDLRPYLRGWSEYFGWCETPWLLRDLDKWVRHRLRCYLWVQWRTPRRRRARLGLLGVKPGLAAYISWSRGPWRPSGSKTLNFAIRNAYFDDLGLPRLYARRA